MRITVISAQVPPVQGGVADYTEAWCEAMREVGHDVTVVTSTRKAAVDGFPVHHFAGPWSTRGAAQLAEVVSSSKPDCVVIQYAPHAYSPRGGGLAVALLFRRLTIDLGVPVVIQAHELYGAWDESLKRIPWHLTQRIAMAVFAHSATAIVVTVRRRQRQLRRLLWPWRRRVHEIPIGPTVKPLIADPRWRDRHGINADTFVLTSLGLGHWSQDVDLLRRTLDALIQAGVDAHLYLAGKFKIEHPNVTSLGYVSASEASDLLSAGDLFVLPLTDGASGRRSSIISALGAGSAVLSTHGSNTDPSLFDPQVLALVPAGDDDAFIAAALRLAKDPAARQDLRRRGHEFYRNRFAWDVIAARWDRLLRESSAPEID